MNTRLCYVTITVADINKAKNFYEDILGFKPTLVYQPTEWYAYDMGAISGGFAITKATKLTVPSIDSLVDFFVDDVEKYWNEVKSQVEVVDKLHHTPWGSYKFVIKDPDGNKLGFTQIEK